MFLAVNLSWNVYAERRRMGLNRSEFARYVGVSRTTIVQIETNKANVTLATVEEIAKGLGMKPNELLMPPKRGPHAISKQDSSATEVEHSGSNP